jgi:hypothetical protein
MKKGIGQVQDTCVYEIDASDQIVSCNEGWEAFAVENGGEKLRFELIEGRSIWGFVADASTTDLYKRLIAHARKGNAIKFTFRCDSPTRLRLLEMKIAPTKPDRVRFTTKILNTAEKDSDNILFAEVGESSDPIVVCSWCGRLNIYRQTWQDIDVAVAKVKIFERSKMPPVSHGICTDCLKNMRGILEQT